MSKIIAVTNKKNAMQEYLSHDPIWLSKIGSQAVLNICTLNNFLAISGEESQGCIWNGCFILTELGGNLTSESEMTKLPDQEHDIPCMCIYVSAHNNDIEQSNYKSESLLHSAFKLTFAKWTTMITMSSKMIQAPQWNWSCL